MRRNHLATYLNDHLAGSVVALELIDHLESTRDDADLRRRLRTVRQEIHADRQQLEALMRTHRIKTSIPRRAAAWFSEKLTELKFRLDDAADGPLHLLEAVEVIALGIDGKRALWRALAAARTPGLSARDYERLEQRALAQRAHIETIRLEAAAQALQPTTRRPRNKTRVSV